MKCVQMSDEAALMILQATTLTQSVKMLEILERGNRACHELEGVAFDMLRSVQHHAFADAPAPKPAEAACDVEVDE